MERLSELAAKPASADPYAEMDSIQKSNLIVFLQEMLRERDSHINLLTGKLDDIQQSLNEALKLLKSRDTELERLKKDKADLEEKFKALESRHGVLLKEHYDTSKSRKGHGRKPIKGKNDGRNDFDGTSDSLNDGGSETAQPEAESLENNQRATEEIHTRRNDASTEQIVQNIRKIVLDVKARMICAPQKVFELLKRAVNYLYTFWDQLFAYRKDGNYSIDNSIAERAIRPITGQRKNIFQRNNAGRYGWRNRL